jgi:hypothetical protein
MKYIFILTVSVILTVCSGAPVHDSMEPIRFAIIGNTYPDSPYSGDPEYLNDILTDLKKKNPLFTVHLGNIFHGGHSWMGLKENDITRQLDYLGKSFGSTGLELYTVAGEKDIYDGRLSLYMNAFRRPVNYSFNCSGVRFIVFNTLPEGDTGKKSLDWLSGELRNSSGYRAIFIFTHNSIYLSPVKGGSYSEHEKFHKLLLDYNVNGVFSLNSADYITFDKDSINYNICGCGGYTKNTSNWKAIHYYIIDIKERSFSAMPVRIKP